MVMFGVIFLTVTHETREMLNEVNASSEEVASVIYAGIKYPMSVGNNSAVVRQMIDIKEKMQEMEVFICGTDRRIVFSSHEGRLRSDLGNYIHDGKTLAALDHALGTGEQPGSVFKERVGEHDYLVHIHTILNEPECYQCHGSAEKVRGAIVLKKLVDRNYAAVAGLRNNNIIISLLGIAVIIGLAHGLLVRMIGRPVESLADDIRTLPEKISRGAALTAAETGRTDEIGVLQNSFSHMAKELDEKTRAIEQSRKDLAKANTDLEAFAYSVSHDLRAPLRNIDGFSKILLDEYGEKIDEKGKHYLTRVRNGTTRMSLLIDDMLTFSRIGRTELQLRPISSKTVIRNVLEYYANEIEARNVTVSVGELPGIYGDQGLLQSLFANLISNALKFTRQTQKPEIAIGYDKRENFFFIRDNGIGFDMQYHDKIFQVFQRLHLPEEYDGTGIGLAIVKRVAERHGGRVWAESTVNKGAEFFIQLPTSQEE